MRLYQSSLPQNTRLPSRGRPTCIMGSVCDLRRLGFAELRGFDSPRPMSVERTSSHVGYSWLMRWMLVDVGGCKLVDVGGL